MSKLAYFMAICITCVMFCLLSFMVYAQERNVGSREVMLGVDWQTPLSSGNSLKGGVVALKLPFNKSLALRGQWRYLDSSYNEAAYTWQQQSISISYQKFISSSLAWGISAGGLNEERAFVAHEFSSEESDLGWLVSLTGIYYLESNSLSLSFENYNVFSYSRHLFKLDYRYQLDKHWFVSARLTLNYNERFEHDINEYQLMAIYTF